MRSLALAMLVACDASTCPAVLEPARDFAAAPALLDLPAVPRLLALGDVHGGYDRMVALLQRWQLLGADAVTWTAGTATLVITGDLIDKGSQSLEAIDLVRALATSAASQGGRVIALLGNHEAEFLASPYNDKAAAFDDELASDQLAPCTLATTDARGVWLRGLPLGARIGAWFFSHAGATQGRTFAALESALEADLTAHDFSGPETIGDTSLLEARAWWEAAADTATTAASAMQVAHFVFGHTPDALGPAGAIAASKDGLLLRIDTGMSPAVDDSHGSLLEITADGPRELRADGSMNMFTF